MIISKLPIEGKNPDTQIRFKKNDFVSNRIISSQNFNEYPEMIFYKIISDVSLRNIVIFQFP